jgi:hypothetical protein
VAANVFYHLKVVADGGLIRVFFNNSAVPAISQIDTAFSFGGIGVRTYNTAAAFGNVSVVKDTTPNAYTLSNNISSTQGWDNWGYQEWNGSSYVNMTWQPSTSQWQGSYPFNLVWAPSQIHPDANDSVVTWTAPRSGSIKITGNPHKQAAAGDGVNVKILQNNTQVWPASGWQYIAGTDTTGPTHNIGVTVAAGDTIRFIVNKNGTRDSDETNWNPTIAYTG